MVLRPLWPPLEYPQPYRNALMQLAEVSIRRPVFATVLSLLILLVGAVSFNRLAVREYPKIDEPVVVLGHCY